MKEYFRIKDNCRNGLIRHLAKVFAMIPAMDNAEMLDIGCGTGVPTIWMAENYSGTVTAVDRDKNSLAWLQKKIHDKKLQDKITILNTSFFHYKSKPDHFDIILAEGFLNVAGFEKGFPKIIEILKRNRFFIIHDEFKDHEKKCDLIRDNNCKLVDTLYLDDIVWWNDYYRQLEIEISSLKSDHVRDLFRSDLKEIEYYKTDPSSFRSIYYLVEKLK